MSILSINNNLTQLRGCVLTYGHFSTIHPGHIRYLNYARSKGTNLVVALKGDKIENNKNIYNYNQKERSEALNSLNIIDDIICLKKNEIDELTKILEPAFLAFGKEFENPEEETIKKAIKLQRLNNRKVIFHAGEIIYSTSELLKGSQNELSQKRNNQFLSSAKRQNLSLSTLQKSLKAWKSAKLLVIGDTIVDQYAACEALGLSAEAPVLVVKELEKKNYIGGAAVVASHIKALGASCEFISIVGDDDTSKYVKDTLLERGIKPVLISDQTRPTTLKKRYVVENQKLFRVSKLEDHNLNKEIEDKLIYEIEEKAPFVNGIVISDFVYGVITKNVLESIKKLSNKYGLLVFGDLQCSSQVGSIIKFKDFSLICPNEKEARIAMQDKDSGLENLSRKLIKITNSENLIMKLGAQGFIAYSKDKKGGFNSQSFPALSVNPIDVAGAGDSLLAVMAVGLSSGEEVMPTATLGCIAASLAVESMGNIPIERNVLELKLQSTFKKNK